MIAERTLKANSKVVNQRLLIALSGTETAIYDSRPARSRRHGKFCGLPPPPKHSSNNINQWSFYQILRMSSCSSHTKSPAIDDFLSAVPDLPNTMS